MINISNNPFSDVSGNPIVGKEIEWLKQNGIIRNELNPFVDSDGFPLKDKISEFSEYISQSKEKYQQDLLKLPINLQQELESNTRLLSERMQVEATGKR